MPIWSVSALIVCPATVSVELKLWWPQPTPPKLSHLPPWYQGLDMAGTKTSAKAQKARRAEWAMMVSSGLEQVEEASANIGPEWEDPVAAGPSLGRGPTGSLLSPYLSVSSKKKFSLFYTLSLILKDIWCNHLWIKYSELVELWIWLAWSRSCGRP